MRGQGTPLTLQRCQGTPLTFERWRIGVGYSSSGTIVSILAILLLLGHVGQSLAQANSPAKDSPFDSWARWAVRQGQWKGPVASWPPIESRPVSSQRLGSSSAPVNVQADDGVSPHQLQAALATLEAVYALFRSRGYPLPPSSDGGRGDTAGFDLYLSPAPSAAGSVHAALDAADLTDAYDAGIAHALLDPSVPEELFLPCIAEAVAATALLSLDPAETASRRDASAALFAYYVSGRFGCDESPASLQATPAQGFGTDIAGAATALLLGLIDSRQRSEEGAYLADLWQFARQTSDDLTALRGSPTLWEAMDVALRNAGERPEDLLTDMTTARYFSGAERGASAPYPLLRELPAAAAVPHAAVLTAEDLPAYLYAAEDLFPLGSAYYRVQTPNASPQEELKVWLRGDPDARWTLVATRLDAQGREQGRMATPPRTESRGYLPLILTRETNSVLLVVTRLAPQLSQSAQRKDAEVIYGSGFKVIIERSATVATHP